MRTPCRKSSRRRDGFTLVEILVTLLLIGLLVGVVLPSVISQTAKGENQRVVDDLESIRSATKLFRMDVQRWPRALDQLVESDTANWASKNDLSDAVISRGLRAKWDGPYLEIGSLPGDTMLTAIGGVIDSAFVTTSWGGTDFLTILVLGIPNANALDIGQLVDGDTSTTVGRLRWVVGDTLLFLATPIN